MWRTGVEVDGQIQSGSKALDEGDRVHVDASATAVEEYPDGCPYRVEGGSEYIVSHELGSWIFPFNLDY